MNYYDTEQLRKDLDLILSVFGERKPWGFYARREFRRGLFCITDMEEVSGYDRIYRVKLFEDKVYADQNLKLPMDSEFARLILKFVLEAEETWKMHTWSGYLTE